MKYRIIRDSDSVIVADIRANDPLRVIVGGEVFSAPRGWITSVSAAIPGHTIEAYEPVTPPPPTITHWALPIVIILERLSDADAELILTWIKSRPAKQYARIMAGLQIDTVSPSPLETAIRTELSNRGYNPDVVLAMA